MAAVSILPRCPVYLHVRRFTVGGRGGGAEGRRDGGTEGRRDGGSWGEGEDSREEAGRGRGGGERERSGEGERLREKEIGQPHFNILQKNPFETCKKSPRWTAYRVYISFDVLDILYFILF